jgi:hypothetical protein
VLPDYWIERPPMRSGRSTQSAVDAFLSLCGAAATDGPVDADPLLGERGDVDRWQLLCGLAERQRIAFHGTGDPAIRSFEPREPVDFAPFGRQKAVFATSDPLWAMFYAIVDRDRHRVTLNNGCIVVTNPEGRPGVPHYYFSITRRALELRPWRTGYVYFLPPDSFVEQPSGTYAGLDARVPQLGSPVAVRPFARLRVAPSDFPLLAHVRGHDDERLAEYAQAVMAAAPWPE